MTKTGSTHLQVSLRDLGYELRARGVHYPNNWWTTAKDFMHESLFRSLFTTTRDDTRAIFADLNSAGDRVVVLSAEGFFGLIAPQLTTLRDMIGDHPIEVVIYFRRWSDWIPSHWQQVVKAGGTETFPEAFVRLFRNPDAYPIGYLRILDNLASVFGHDAIRIVSYSNLMDAKQDIVRHFCDAILDLPDLAKSSEGRTANGSSGLHTTEIARWLNAWCLTRDLPATIRNGRTVMRYWGHASLRDDVAAIEQAMDAHHAVINISDTAPQLAVQYEELMRRYGANIVNPGAEGALFDRRARDVTFIRSDCLLHPGVAERFDRIAPTLVEWSHTPPKPQRPQRRLPVRAAAWARRHQPAGR